jgi:hypothetical protein
MADMREPKLKVTKVKKTKPGYRGKEVPGFFLDFPKESR